MIDPFCPIFAYQRPKGFAMRRLLILIASISTIYNTDAQQYITFDEAVALAFDENLSLKSAKYDIEVADYEQRAAEGLYFPSVDIIGGYILLQHDVAIDISGKNGMVENIANKLINNGVSSGILTTDAAQLIGGLLSPLSSMNLSYVIQKRSLGFTAAKVTMPIYAGGKIRAANRAAKIRRSMAEQRLTSEQNHLYTTLVEQYYGVVILQYAVDVRKSVVDVMRQHLSDAKAMEDAGEIAHSVVLGVEYRLAEAERELANESHRLYMANRLLRSTLNINYDIYPTDELFIDRSILSVDYYIDNAINLNPILAEANMGVELASEGVKIARANMLPEIAAMGLASLYSPNLSEIAPRWAVGIEANFTIFNGMAKENKLRASKAVAEGVVTQVENARNNIRLLVENEYYNVINALDNIATAESAIRLVDSYFHSSQDGFKAGVATSTELMDAEINRSASRLSYLNAVYEYCISLTHLLEASGLSYTLNDYRENSIKPEYIIKSK